MGYEKGVHYSFIESHVDCALADTCNHASFLAVKDWLNKYSSTTVAIPYLQLTMQLVDSNDPTLGLFASADSFRTFKISNGGDREEVAGIYDGEYLRIPFSPDTQYEIEISIDGYQTKTVTFLSKAYIDQPSYHLGTVSLDSVSAEIPYLNLTMQLVDSNDPTLGLFASADSFRTFKIGSGGDREEVAGIYDGEYLRIPFSPDTQYDIEISIDGYQTKTVTFLSKAYIDQPSYPLGTVTLDSISVSPPSQLNDTGITWGGNYPSGNNTTCTSNIDAPQDCHQGRDATHNDPSDGHGGFSFTKLDQSGNSLPASATTWSCVRDNVTGLVWEVKTDDGGIHDRDNYYRWGGKTARGTGYGTYYPDWDTLVDGSNSQRLCGSNDWRVPTRAELQGLVHYGRINPAIDTDYFPNTLAQYFWSASPGGGSMSRAWFVYFFIGLAGESDRDSYGHVRLVRSGQ